jgi:hypothetical protein
MFMPVGDQISRTMTRLWVIYCVAGVLLYFAGSVPLSGIITVLGPFTEEIEIVIYTEGEGSASGTTEGPGGGGECAGECMCLL